MEPDLQTLLVSLGYLASPFEQGELDEATRAAVRRFQELHGLPPSGEPDEETRRAISEAYLNGECIVTGEVVDAVGPISQAFISVKDRDLGAAQTWETLGSGSTDWDGRFVFRCTMEQIVPGDRISAAGIATADLIFDILELPTEFEGFDIFRLPEDERVSEEDRALGIQARRVEEVRLVVRGTGRRALENNTEYERLLNRFRTVWPEVSPADLDDERSEPAFVARELDVEVEQVRALVSAFRLASAFGMRETGVPEPILYGLARSKYQLTTMFQLALAGVDALKEGIRDAVERGIIPDQPLRTVGIAVTRIGEIAPGKIIDAEADVEGTGFAAMIHTVVPEDAGKIALITAAAGQRDTPKTMWDRLGSAPEFSTPGALSRAQFAFQLDMLANRHLPLMDELLNERELTSARDLLDLGIDELKEIVARPEIGAPEGTPGDELSERAQVYATGLIGQLQLAFPTETVAKLLSGLPAETVGGTATQASLKSVLSIATSEAMRDEGGALDIRTSNLESYFSQYGSTVFAEVAEEDRPEVVRALKRVQRLHRVSTGVESLEWLIENNYTSAFDIAQVPRQVFVAQASKELGEAQAMIMHSRARYTADATVAAYVHIQDAAFGAYPTALLMTEEGSETPDQIRQIVAKHLPSWSEEFNQVSFCDCHHCRSIYSPAAYLVDLLSFLDNSAKNAEGKNPFEVLQKRRPDIAKLKLTCENTNTALPYIDLINEVLESLALSLVDPWKSLDIPAFDIPAFDTEDATTEELQAAAQNTNWNAYVTPSLLQTMPRMDSAVYPLSLPFDAPLTAMRLYLAHLEVARADLMAAFGSAGITNDLAAELLGLGPAAFAVIGGEAESGPTDLSAGVDSRYGFDLRPPPDLALGSVGRFVWALKRKLNMVGASLSLGSNPTAEKYESDAQTAVEAFQADHGLTPGLVDRKTWQRLLAIEPSVATATLPHVPTFLERTGLSNDELIRILKMRFVNPEVGTFGILQKLDLPSADLLAFIQAGLENPGQDLLDAIEASGVAEQSFMAWATAHLAGDALARLKLTILIDGPSDEPCNLDKLTMRYWDSSAPWLVDPDWFKLDQLVRLWRALAWSFEDLDTALVALGAAKITPAVLRQLAQIRELARVLDVPVQEVVALWADLRPGGPDSLYDRRFSSRALVQTDPAFDPDWSGKVLAGAQIGDHTAALQSGLRCGGPDLAALREHVGLTEDSAPLDLPALSELFRHIVLAKALRINVRDLIRMIDLTGLKPFQAPTEKWDALTFAQEVQQLKDGGLNAAQLSHILSDVKHPPKDEARDQMLRDLQNGLKAIAFEYADANRPTPSFLRRALNLLTIEPTLVDAALQVLIGMDMTTVLLSGDPVPRPTVPVEWSARFRYDPTAPSISCLGALTTNECEIIKGFSTDERYPLAAEEMFQKPRTLLKQLASALKGQDLPELNAEDILAESVWVNDSAIREAAIQARLRQYLTKILPPLRDRLSRVLIKQTLTALEIDAASIALLLEGKEAPYKPLFPATDRALPLIHDLQALTESQSLLDATKAYELLARVAQLIEALDLSATDLGAIARHLVSFRPTDDRLLDYEGWKIIAAYGRVRRSVGQPKDKLAALWQLDTIEATRAALADALDWPEEMVDDLIASLGHGLSDLRNVDRIERLIAAGELVRKLGVKVGMAAIWARETIDQLAADDARRIVKGKYAERAWLEVAKTLSDPLRESQRTALVAYLLPRLDLKDSNALYQQMLIDVEMSPCMLTSRIKQAISTVQLFVQRCLLSLEKPSVHPSSIDSEHWKWMQNYRIWEANRKILLYPENWIRPELRDDKTPQFKELESELIQNDLTDLNAERALLSYLEKLNDIARLSIVGLHVQHEFEPDEKLQTVVHIFGRTENSPASHYYRQYTVTRNGAALWTSWELVSLDIHPGPIAPVVFNRRLYLFWTETSKTDPKNVQPQIRLAWSEYRHGAWSPKNISDPREVLVTPASEFPDTTFQGVAREPGPVERLEAKVHFDRLTVHCILSRSFHVINHASASSLEVGSFLLDGCQGKLVAIHDKSQTTYTSGMVVRRVKDLLEAKQLAEVDPVPEVSILNFTYDGSRIAEDAWVHRYQSYMALSDNRRAYLAHLDMTPVSPSSSAADPEVAYPYQKYEIKPGIALDKAVLVKVRRINAEAAMDSWSSAKAALVEVGKSSWYAGPSGTRASFDIGIQQSESIDRVGGYDSSVYAGRPALKVRFENLYHPFVCTFIRTLQQYGVTGLLNLANQRLRFGDPDFGARYSPNPQVVAKPHPLAAVDFGETERPGIYRSTAYSTYNWELFFHIPLLIAERLHQNQRFEDAMRWLHHVFDPTDGTASYWKFLPLLTTPGQTLEDWLKQLNAGDPELKKQIAEWKDHPFEPHRIARMRLTAYKKYVFMRYLDTVLARADQLFANDTIESINAATQFYVMAADLLGKRIERIPPAGEPKAATYLGMRGKIDALGNFAAEFENSFPFLSSSSMASSPETSGLLGISKSLYFCTPQNDKLLGYWDTVADRLFKIRNCMNISGVARQLPLFEPAIDPALLVQAAAQGLDLSSVLSDLSAPRPHYRFVHVLDRALDACNDVMAFGASLLSALEKRDAEALTLLRATHDTALREASLEARKQQEKEALERASALQKARAVPITRLLHYRKLIGRQEEELVEPEFGVEIPLVADSASVPARGGAFLVEEEIDELNASHSARDWQVISATYEIVASLSHYVPTFEVPTSPATKFQFGGPHIGPGIAAIARYVAMKGQKDAYNASHAGKMAGYKRRHQEYVIQANIAAREIMQIDREITAANIRAAVAKLERETLEKDIAQTELVEDYLKTKYTTSDLYGWMQGQISNLYLQSYQLAFVMAKGAERCYRFERGVTSSNYVQFGAWDSLKKGLLAGEKLHLQLRQLERAFLDQNARELELTKHVSILQHDPLALLRLRETGSCEIDIPELLLDMDHPGHYMRRLKSVSLTIPAVAGPYTPVNACLTLLTNETRKNADLRNDKYERDLQGDDDRFVRDFAPTQAIATSTGQNDSGMFELNFRDERYLPFEGAGAVGRWRLELDPDCNRFDLGTVTDIVLQLKYTARDGGQLLRKKAKEHLTKLLADAENVILVRLFSLRHEFPTEWNRFVNAPASPTLTITVDLTIARFPYLAQGRNIVIRQANAIAGVKSSAPASLTIAPGQNLQNLSSSPWTGEAVPGLWTVGTSSDPKLIKDIFVVLAYALESS